MAQDASAGRERTGAYNDYQEAPTMRIETFFTARHTFTFERFAVIQRTSDGVEAWIGPFYGIVSFVRRLDT